MKFTKPLAPALIFLCFCTIATAQTSPNILDSFAREYVKKIHQVNEENVLVHTDRKVYSAGEKIWFSAYLSKAADNRLDTASKSLFVDLVNSQDKPVAQLVLSTANLNTQGAISLNDSLPAGLYWLRGYTMKMAKEDTNDIYIQPLYIYNFAKPGNGQNSTDASTAGLYSNYNNTVVHFFPERITRIQSIYTTGALQVTDAVGNPIATTGNIVNSNDSVVENFATNRFGLARINFYNNKLQKFTAVVHAKNGDIKYPLPNINPFKSQVSITGSNGNSMQAIVTLEDSVYSSGRTSYVLGISHGHVYFSTYGKGMYKMAVPLDNFPGGMAALVLLDSAQHVLCERDFFVHKDNYTITVQPDKDSYTKRDAVQLGVQLIDAAGRPLKAALNISVQDGGLEQVSDALETDSAGPANHAMDEWFLRNEAKLSAADMDLFMLARSPQYPDWTGGNNPVSQFNDGIDKLQYLAGTVSDRKGRPLKETIVTEQTETKDDDIVFGRDTTGLRGTFKLPIPPSADTLALKLSITDRDGYPRTSGQIALDSFAYPVFATPVSLKSKFFASNVSIQKRLDTFDGSVVFNGVGKNWLKPVFVQTKGKKIDPYDGTRISATSHIISPETFNQGDGKSIGNALLSTVPGVSLNGGMVSVHGSILGEPMVVVDGVPIIVPRKQSDAPRTPTSKTGQSTSLTPKASLPGTVNGDDNPYFDPNGNLPSIVIAFLNTLNPQDVDYIEVLVNQSEAAFYGSRGANGVIYVHTKNGSGKYVEPDAGMVLIHPLTYHTAPKFIMPDYSTALLKNSKTTDPRTTIFWDGRLLTGTDGKAQAKFFTADDNSTYTVTVTGITQNGDYIYKRITINRK